MAMVAVFVPRAIENRIVSELEQHGFRVAKPIESARAFADAAGDEAFDTLIVGSGPNHLTREVLETCDVRGIRIVALASTDAERRHAVDLGVLEVVDADAPWSHLARFLDEDRVFGRPEMERTAAAGSRSAERHGEVLTVWGPAGAPGRTTLAINIAAELAEQGHSVVLADADTHSGSVAPALGLLDEAPGFAAACRLAASDSLTIEELERVSERYQSPHGSFWVLTGIGRPHRWPELSGERVVATIAACREWVDFTVIDTGFCLENDEEISSDLFAPRRNAATISALREADRVVAVGSGDPVGLSRFLRAHVDLLEIVDAERVLTVVNRIRGSVIGANPAAQVEQTLLRFGGIESPVLVPHDQGALDAAILAGKTLRDVAGKSAPRLAVSKLVASRILPPTSTAGANSPSRRERRSRFEPVPG
ncbi:MAG: regulator [Cryobacterium sp.]|nr:regulator [Cryobacterium sp.]